ncbi:MAG: hypothetical protein ABI623_08630 [bacterium]
MMGYYTCYCLEIKTADNSGPHPDALAIIAQLRAINENANYALDERGSTEMDAKWYDHRTELLEFSKSNPDALFVLYGDGESGEDSWYSYFRNGNVQNAPVRLEYDEFDESKLE